MFFHEILLYNSQVSSEKLTRNCKVIAFLHQTYNIKPSMPPHAFGCECIMGNKRNVVLYLDRELVEKTKELGFNLSKTVENYLKQLITHFSHVNIQNNGEIDIVGGSPGEIRTLVSGSKALYACPLHHRASYCLYT